ncbi:hypothetical protein DSM106972_049700 [Dulcicalothrix desertica PCC 7102]|uniref:Uncharacterized protein n=1 Tax=Dulcicalothrix desertica PCC 7102 TaxID=232991 RepID=A0A3S1ALS5_9CYAN|nr:hypothetical protein [Dulcicalothrix desertica]RUT04056.1 hypothetical protein DSM106972_049700 [Dulcicalothrix desertica PCC 7102]TWH43542.1 hypothetical protein CAL7102_07275 [Dulcicalothrix desertica PCC 7102]
MKLNSVVSIKVVRLVRYFYLALGFSLLIASLFLSGCSNDNTSGTSLNWQNTNAVPKSLLLSATTQNTILPSTQINAIKVAVIPTREKNNLYIFNFNSPNLCGELGCLYAGYLSDGQGSKQVLNLYLQPNVLPGKHLITLVNDDSKNSSGLPCLDVQQVINNTTVQKLIYCFNGNDYQPVENTLIKV